MTRALVSRPVRATTLGRRWYARLYLLGKRLAEATELRLFRENVEPGMTIVDMGANVGFYTAAFSRLVGENGRVYAFEPDAFSSTILRDRVRRVPLTNVQVECAAVGATDEPVNLYCSKRDRAETRTFPLGPSVPVEVCRVPMLSLDSYCRDSRIDHIDAIKMDVEGREVDALRGMRHLMETRPPAWMFIEFSPRQLRGAGASPEEFWEELAEDGYVGYELDDRGAVTRIADPRAFTEAHAEGTTDVWAVHKTRPQPVCSAIPA